MNNKRRKKYMYKYAMRHGIPIPKGFRPNINAFGKPARRLAFNILRHANKMHYAIPSRQFDDLVKPMRVKVMEVVRSQLGTKEWPPFSNSGEVLRYLKSAGITFPAPWCASFVTWCLKKAGLKGLPDKPAWVPAWEAWAERKGWVVPKHKARKGDIVTFQFDSDATGDHIGFVTRNLGIVKGITTIEGNATSDAAPGGGVVRKWRPWSQVHLVIRIPNYPD